MGQPGEVVREQPDLWISSITPNSGYVFGNESNVISVTVNNTGNAAAGAFSYKGKRFTGGSVQRASLISVTPHPLAVNFSANETSGMAPSCVQFTNLTPVATAWQWDFGDGSANSTLQNPVHVYAMAGDYMVKLTATNTYTGNMMTKTNFIHVMPIVVTFPDRTNLPRDINGDGIYEDINGNGRLDFDDVVVFYQNMDWVRDNINVGIGPYDFNGNGRLDFDDIVQLFQTVLG